MKKMIIPFLCLIATSVSANVDYLQQSVLSTFGEVAQAHALEEIEAIGAVMSQQEVETQVLVHDETRGHEEVLEFGCHLHGSQMACHPHGHNHLKEASFNDFIQSINTSFEAIKKSFAVRGISTNAVEEVKFWKGAHSHFVGQDEVFGKFVYEVNGADETIYTECHRHGANDPVECHFVFSGEGEPDLGGGHQH